jgi:hypothetical protein
MTFLRVFSALASVAKLFCVRTRPARSLVATTVSSVLKSTPMAMGPAALSCRSSGGRPPVDSPSISATRPRSFSSSTMSETVER